MRQEAHRELALAALSSIRKGKEYVSSVACRPPCWKCFYWPQNCKAKHRGIVHAWQRRPSLKQYLLFSSLHLTPISNSFLAWGMLEFCDWNFTAKHSCCPIQYPSKCGSTVWKYSKFSRRTERTWVDSEVLKLPHSLVSKSFKQS